MSKNWWGSPRRTSDSRKIGVPIEEIRKLEEGKLSFSECITGAVMALVALLQMSVEIIAFGTAVKFVNK